MLGNRFPSLIGRVYQYNTTSGVFDFGLKTGAANQLWKLSESQTQLINQLTNLPLAVDANVEWTLEFVNGGMLITNLLTSRAIDCYGASVNPGAPCITWKRHSGANQVFYQIFN